MLIKYPCEVCSKAKSHNAIQWDLCECGSMLSVIKSTCKHTDFSSSVTFNGSVLQNTMPFGNLTDHELFQILHGNKIKFTTVTQSSIKPYKNLIIDLNSTIDNFDQIMFPLLRHK